MNILDSVFKRYRPSEDNLLKYGFIKQGDEYHYSFELNNGDFIVNLIVVGDNVLSKIIDKEFGDEFIGIDAESYDGAFIGDLREEYKSKLENIREACFFKVPFASNQSNRLVEFLYNTYGEKPDFPFEGGYEDAGVFRYRKNRKWYGIIMNINKSLLTKKKGDVIRVDVINVKINPEDREELLKINGLYICYHMNKQKWISIILDETVPDSLLFDLVTKSRELIINNKK